MSFKLQPPKLDLPPLPSRCLFCKIDIFFFFLLPEKMRVNKDARSDRFQLCVSYFFIYLFTYYYYFFFFLKRPIILIDVET